MPSRSSAALPPAVLHLHAAALRRTRRHRSTLRAAVWRSKLRRRPSEPAAGVRHHAAAPRLREPYPVYAGASCAHIVCTAPKHALRAGARVELPPPAPSSAGRSSAIIAGFTSYLTTHCWSLEAPQSFLPVNSIRAAS